MRKRNTKVKKFMRNCPLAVCILVSWGLVSAVEYAPQMQQMFWHVTKKSEKVALVQLETSGEEERADATDLLERGLAVGDVFAGISKETAENIPEQKQEEPEAQVESEEAGQSANEPTAEETDSKSAQKKKIKPVYVKYKKTKTDSPWYTDPGKIPQTTEFAYQSVKKDYFSDALFIGDSRTVGLCDYSGLTNATFFAKTGLTVYNLFEDAFVEDPDSKRMVTVDTMLKKYRYGKIYLMVGINELGTGGTERFQKEYRSVLKKLRKWQPDAVIYVQSIMGVTSKKDRSDPVINNTNIRDKNYAISKLTDGIHIFYLNIQEIYEDEDHALRQELTFDDVHLYAQHYKAWVKYLKTHAVVRGEEA